MNKPESHLATASRERLQGLLRQSFFRNRKLKRINKILTNVVGLLLTIIAVGVMTLYQSH